MANLLFIYSFMSSLLATLTVTSATATDIYCLKSIKDSVIDPHGYINTTWDFGNNTEGFVCRFLGVECWHPEENRVLNIRLSDLGLKGQFPLGLENCTSLTGLDLSLNKLQDQYHLTSVRGYHFSQIFIYPSTISQEKSHQALPNAVI